MSEIEQLRREVSELRARLAKLEDQHPRVVGPAVAGLPSVQFTPPQWVEPNYFPPVPMRHGEILCQKAPTITTEQAQALVDKFGSTEMPASQVW